MIGDAERFSRLGGTCVAYQAIGQINTDNGGAGPGDMTCVAPFTASKVDHPASGHMTQKLTEGRPGE